MKRELVPFVVSRLIGGRPVRWAPARRLVGDYDGRDRTLQVFNADPRDQRALLDVLDEKRDLLRAAAGGPLVIIFHSVRQSMERYGDFVKHFPKPRREWRSRVLVPERVVDEANIGGPHRRVRAA